MVSPPEPGTYKNPDHFSPQLSSSSSSFSLNTTLPLTLPTLTSYKLPPHTNSRPFHTKNLHTNQIITMSSGRPNYRQYRQPLMNFLTLAPSVSKQPLTAEALAAVAVAVPKADEANAVALAETKRRTSSLSSEGSKTGLRFLKLNNHHHDTNGDFAEEAVVE